MRERQWEVARGCELGEASADWWRGQRTAEDCPLTSVLALAESSACWLLASASLHTAAASI